MTGHADPQTLFRREMGQGSAPVVLLHCGLGHSGMWKGVAAALDSRARMSAPDLPGHGRSPGFPAGIDVVAAAAQAVDGLIRPGTHLVGHSFGAVVALSLALARPGDVASLTLIEPVFFAAAPDHPETAPHRAAEEAIFAVYETGDHRAAAEAFNALWGGGVPWDRFPPDVQEAMTRQMPFVRNTEPALWRDTLGLAAAGRLETLEMPVHLLRGSATVRVIAAVQEALAARLPHVRETVIDGAAHMLVMSHAGAVAAAIAETLDWAATARHPEPSPAAP